MTTTTELLHQLAAVIAANGGEVVVSESDLESAVGLAVTTWRQDGALHMRTGPTCHQQSA